MKKYLSKFLIMAFTMLLCVSTSITNANAAENSNTDYWRGKFPEFDAYMSQNQGIKFIGEDEVYIKFTLKEGTEINSRSLTKEDYNQEVYTRAEYESETLNSIKSARISIGPSIPVNPEPYWLRLDLQVYQESGASANRLMAVSFWQWKTKPIFLFTDLNGIYVSEGAIIGTASSVNPMISKYNQMIDNKYMQYNTNKIDIDKNSKGMMGIIDINGGTELAPVTSHMGMTQTPIERVNTSVSKIIISTSYIHKQVALGLPSFDDKGKPSFGLDISTDEHSARVEVAY